MQEIEFIAFVGKKVFEAAKNNNVFAGFLIFIVGVLISSAIYHITMKLKGSLKILTDKEEYNNGDTIKGKITLTVRKNIKCRKFNIRLYREIRFIRISDKSEQTKITFEEEKILANDIEYLPGQTPEYEFEFTFPETEPSAIQINLKDFFGEEIAKAYLENQSFNKGLGIRWYLDASIDAEGVDIFCTIPLKVRNVY